MASDASFSCSLFGCKVFCFTPKQQCNGNLVLTGQNGTGENSPCSHNKGPVCHGQKWFSRKRRDVWIRNALIFLYGLGGFGGLVLLAAVLGGHYFRSPKFSCFSTYIGDNDDFCREGLVPDSDPLEIWDFGLLLAACVSISLAAVGIIATVKRRKCFMNAASIGLAFTIALQLGVGISLYLAEVQTSYRYPYVPQQVQEVAKDKLQNDILRCKTEPHQLELWNNLQHEKCCCGVTSYKDWEVIAHMDIPSSCHCHCSRSYNQDCDWSCPSDSYYDGDSCRNGEHISSNVTVPTKGCLPAILQNIGSHRRDVVQTVSIMALCLTSLQLLAALGPLFACFCGCCCVQEEEMYSYKSLSTEVDSDEESRKPCDNNTHLVD